MATEEKGIGCGKFQKKEPLIKDITESINRAKGVVEKSELAGKLLKEVEALLDCDDYKDENVDCKNCQTIAFLRKKTAELFIRAKKLA